MCHIKPWREELIVGQANRYIDLFQFDIQNISRTITSDHLFSFVIKNPGRNGVWSVHMHTCHSGVIVICDPHGFNPHKYWIFDDFLTDGAWHLGGPPFASCTYPQEGGCSWQQSLSRGKHLSQQNWHGNERKHLCMCMFAAWSTHILFLMRCCLYKPKHHRHRNWVAENAPIPKDHSERMLVYVKCVCVQVCCCICFSFYNLTAACLAGTVMMVVSTGWLLGNNYLTVLCLHWITHWAVCVLVLAT